MKKNLFVGAAAAALLLQPISGALAQSTTTSPPGVQSEQSQQGQSQQGQTQQGQTQQNEMQQNESTPGEATGTTDVPTTGTQAQDQPQGQSDNPLMQMTAGELIGKSVVNQQGEEVGEIEDIVIGTSDQQVQAVLSVGGFLGIGDKNVAVPFSELQPGQEDNVLLSSGATVEELKQRPAYDEAAGDFEAYPRERTPAEGSM